MPHRRTTATLSVAVAVSFCGCSGPSEPAGEESPSPSPPPAPPREVVVHATATTGSVATERLCLEEEGLHLLEAEAAGGNAAMGYLAIDDGSQEGETVVALMRFADQPRRIRSERVELHAGEPCYLITADTGVSGERATTRLIRLDDPTEPVPANASSDTDEPTGFSAPTTELLELYEELHSFKDNPAFHRAGFGTCCRFRDWMTRVEALGSRSGLEPLTEIGVLPGDLLVLGRAYLRSRGRPTEYTREMESLYRSGLSALAR